MKKLLALALILGCEKPAPPPARPDAGTRVVRVDPSLLKDGRVKVATAEARAPETEVGVPGEVVAGEGGEAQVTPLVSGRVATLDAAIGQPVKKGQTLCVIESPEVGRAQADLLRAESRAALADRALARQADLDSQGATSKSALDQARAEAAAAHADEIAAKATLANIGAPPASADAAVASSKIVMRSPIDGVVVERTAILGGPVNAGATLFRVVVPGMRVVIAKLPETLDAQADDGTHVRVVPRSAPSQACAATIEHNLHVVDANRNVPLRVRLGDACPELTLGSFVEVRLPARAVTTSAVVVPAEALVDVRSDTIVFVEKSEGVFEARAVKKGTTTPTEVALTSGVAPGERVAVAGVVLLKGELVGVEQAP